MRQRAGVTDAAWLSAVETHHERLNGTGYPAGAKGEQIGPMARLLAVCDTYSAMVKPRPYRPKGQATHTQLALREIFSDQGTTVDSGFAALLIKTIGVLPPGSIVRLKCGEVAIVRDTVTSLTQARVWTLYDRTQMPVLEPVPRDTSNPGHEIDAPAPAPGPAKRNGATQTAEPAAPPLGRRPRRIRHHRVATRPRPAEHRIQLLPQPPGLIRIRQ